LIKFAALKF